MDSNNSENKPGANGNGSSSMPTWIVILLSIIGFVYLITPTFGIFELIPDFIPIVGNLDEGVAAILVWQGLQLFMNRKKSR